MLYMYIRLLDKLTIHADIVHCIVKIVYQQLVTKGTNKWTEWTKHTHTY